MTFEELDLIEPILKALKEKGYKNPSPIQEQSIPILLGRNDLLGCAQTGTGKTAAFSIPILQFLTLEKEKSGPIRKIRALVVTPTRELAIQIADSFTAYGKFTGLTNTVIFGGVKQYSQEKALKRKPEILVATPGRLLDLINQGIISLRDLEFFVLDEADQMLDMGFLNDIKKIIAKLPAKRQSLFFSATMPKNIRELSHKILKSPKTVTIKPEQATAEKVEQAVYMISQKDKPKLLTNLINAAPVKSILIFGRTKHGCNKVVKFLEKNNISAAAIHGNKSQAARVKALEGFKNKEIKALVATDIAARGIDVSALELVINYELPNLPETYVHRIGRTGRAEASGMALSFCDAEERFFLKDIEKLIHQKIKVVTDHPFVDNRPDMPPKPQGGGGRGGGRGGSRPPKRGNFKRR